MKASEIEKILKQNCISRKNERNVKVFLFSDNNIKTVSEELEFKLTGKLSDD